MRALDLFFLRPFGSDNLSRFAAISITSGWVLIVILATVQGAIWASITHYLVPDAFAAARPFAAFLMFALIFTVIWLIGAMLLMYQRTPGAPLRERSKFWLGIGVRLGIIAISAVMTGSFLELAIRQEAVTREIEFERQDIRAQALAQIEAREQSVIVSLADRKESEIRKLQNLRTERDQAIGPLGDDITALVEELARSRQEAELELTGADGRPPGKGRNYDKAMANAQRIETELREKRAERDRRAAKFEASMTDFEQRVDAIDAQITEAQHRLDSVRSDFDSAKGPLEELAGEYGLQVPRDGLSIRLEMLERVKEREGTTYLESVQGLSSAFLGLLFLALVAIKLFEPRSMRLYYNEHLQRAYGEYRAGRFGNLPGFPTPETDRALPFTEFAETYTIYEADPEFFYELWRKAEEHFDPTDRSHPQDPAVEDRKRDTLRQLHDNIVGARALALGSSKLTAFGLNSEKQGRSFVPILAGAVFLTLVVGIPALAPSDRAERLDLDEFHWGWLIGTLASGQSELILQQESDFQLLALWYMGAMVDYLSTVDEAAVWYDPRCYVDLYRPELKTMINAVAVTAVGPSLIADLVETIRPENGSELSRRFPYASGLLRDVTEEWSNGAPPYSTMQLLDLRRLIRERAKLDTYRLIHQYGCDPEGPTVAVFDTMYRLMERYSGIARSEN